MKKQILIAGLLMISAITFGQKKEIKAAQKLVKSNNFSEAITALKQVEGLVATADANVEQQYYVVLGQAYLGDAGNDYDKMEKAGDAFEKASAVNKNGKYKEDIEIGLNDLKNALIESAKLDQQSKRYVDGSKKLYKGYNMSKQDTIFLYYAASFATDGKDYDAAITYYSELLDIGFTGIVEEFYAVKKGTKEEKKFNTKKERDLVVKSGDFVIPTSRKTKSKKADILKSLTFIYNIKGETEKAKELIAEARKENPDDIDLLNAEANMYYKANDMANYKRVVNEMISKDPNNPQLYYNLGVASKKNGEIEEASKYYDKAIELKPDYVEALINKSQIILSGEAAIIEEMNGLGTSDADYDRYDELKEVKNELYKDALPYLEKALNVRKDDVDIIRTLKSMYDLLGMDDKAKEMRNRLAEIEG